MKHTKVKDLLNSTTTLQEVNAKGWVRTFRNNQFIALNDGSTINNIPVSYTHLTLPTILLV